MKFTFELTEQDYLDFNMFTVKNYKFYQKQLYLFRILFTMIPYGIVIVDYLLTGTKGADFMVGFSVAMVPLSVLFWFGFPKLYDALTLKNAKKILFKEGKNNIFGERTLFFESNKIRTVTKLEESSILYEAITQVKQSEQAIYLYTSPAMALILPLRVLANEAEKQAYFDFINAKLG